MSCSRSICGLAQHSISTSQGSVQYSIYGSESFARPVFYFHGFPSSRLEPAVCDDVAKFHDVTLIAPDRPGFGGSAYREGRALLDWPPLVAELADHFKLERFAVCGLSGGSPYAFACAYALPARIRFATIISGISSIRDADDLVGMNLPAQLAFRLHRRSKKVSRCAITFLRRIFALNPSLVFCSAAIFLGLDDRKILWSRRSREHLAACVREGLRGHCSNTFTDFNILASKWPFAVRELKVPVTLIHGDDDRLLPLAMAVRHAQELASATLTVLQGRGHFFALKECNLIIEAIRKQWDSFS